MRGLTPPQAPKPAKRGQARAYQAAVEAVLAPAICAGLGYWADTHFDSSPWGLIVGVVIGFAAMVLRLVRLGQDLGLTEDDDEGNDSSDASR